MRRPSPALLLAAVLPLAALPAFCEPLELAAFGAQASFEQAGASVDEAVQLGSFKRAPAASPLTKPAFVAPGALAAPLYEIPLAPILNNIRRTAATFRAGGELVHVFGDKSENKNEWFIGLAVEDVETEFKKGWKILHYWAKFGSETWHVELGGRMYAVHIDGQLRHKMQSKVVVEPADKNEPKSVFTIEQLSEAAFAAGLPVRIGGTQYRLLYSQNFNEDAQGNFAGYTVDRSIVLMFRNERGELKGYHWFEKDIPERAVLVTTPRVAGSEDSYEAGQVTLGLRLAGGKLQIYYPVAAPPTR